MEQNDLNIFETKIDETGKAHLLETVRWTKFMAIMGFIFVGFIFVAAIAILAAGPMFSSSASSLGADLNSGIGILYIISAIIYIYPVFALLKFSSAMKRGLNSGNQELINEGFRYQKTMYRYIGILTIISLIIMLVAFILGGIGMMSR